MRVVSPKTAAVPGWWVVAGKTCWAAYQPKGAASQAASYTDLTGNGNNAGVGVAPSWASATGWTFDGATQYLTTTFVPSSDQSQAVLVQFSGYSGSGYIAGLRQTNDYMILRPSNVSVMVFSNGGATTTGGAKITAGNMAISGNKAYKNGVDEGLVLNAWTLIPAIAPYIGCANRDGSPTTYGAATVQAVAIYSDTLTAGEVTTVSTAMAAL